MNSITNSGMKLPLAVAAFAFIALSLVVAPKAQAADLGFDYFGGDYGYMDGGYDYFGGDYGYTNGGYDYYGGDYGYTNGGYDYYGGDYGYDNYGSGGGSSYGSYGGFGGYSTPSYSMPTYRYPQMSGGGSQAQSQAQSSVNNNVNTNTIIIGGTTTQNPPVNPPVVQNPVCVIYASTTYIQRVGQAVTLTWTSTYTSWGTITGIGNVSTNGSMTVYPNTTTTYTGTFWGTNGQAVTCSATVTLAPTYNPVYPVYPQTPYVTLSAAPYTGLEMGPVGTALYWSFLVLWCLVAAYLIVVKRIQNTIVSKLNAFLFGASATRSHSASTHTTHAASHKAAKVEEEDAIDPFIASQISR